MILHCPHHRIHQTSKLCKATEAGFAISWTVGTMSVRGPLVVHCKRIRCSCCANICPALHGCKKNHKKEVWIRCVLSNISGGMQTCIPCMQENAVGHLMALIVQDSPAIFMRVAFDVLIVHGMQLACLRNPPPCTAMDNFLSLLSTIVEADSVEKATTFAKTCIATAFDATRDACRRRKGALLPRPLHRMFIGIVNEILPCEKVPLFITLDQLAAGLRSLEPRLYPAFCFSWLEILAHRKVMVPMLSVRS